MKIETVPQDVTVHGEFVTSEFELGDAAWIVDMFADKVYSHKERAVIRELACNAHDSQVMAGTTNIKFNVHLPTILEPFLSIRDYGTGLSDNEVRKIFAGIGISTKRDSNDVIGCFGIGSLSPYSMTDSFTVKSYKNGVCRVYNCYRDDSRKPMVALLAESDTDEANGVEVSLSVNDKVYEFEEAAVQVFRFWEGTLPDINNESVVRRCEQHQNAYLFQGDDFGISNEFGDMYAVMGNISYRIPYSLCDMHAKGYLKFELGELEFDTGRENLAITDKVRSAIKSKFDDVHSRLPGLIKAYIDAGPTVFKRAQMAEKFSRGKVPHGVPHVVQDYTLPLTTEPITVWCRSGKRTEKLTVHSLPLGDKYEYYTYKPRMTSRIRAYIKETNAKIVLLTPQQITECQIDADVLMDLDDLPKIERTYTRQSGPVIKTFSFRYLAYGKAADHWKAVDVDTGADELVYVEINRWEPCSYSIISGDAFRINASIEALSDAGIDVPVIYGLKTAYLKSKAFSSANWIHIDEYVKREVTKRAPSGVYEYSSIDYRKLEYLYETIDSDELTEWKEFVDIIPDRKLADIAIQVGIEVEQDTTFQEWMDDFMSKYPIIKLVESYQIRRNPQAFAPYIGGTKR